jgi:hypothetical protein
MTDEPLTGKDRGSIFDAITPHMIAAAMIGKRPSPNPPQPGYWRIKLVKGGRYVPACIRWVHTTTEPGEPDNRMERSRFLAAFIAEEPTDLHTVWQRRGDAISEGQYRLMCADLQWAKDERPNSPEAQERRAVDWHQGIFPF